MYELQGWQTVDLFQNPVAYYIETFADLRDIQDKAVADTVIYIILRRGFESIMFREAAAGEAHKKLETKESTDTLQKQKMIDTASIKNIGKQ